MRTPKHVTLTLEEYFTVYRHYKHILRPIWLEDRMAITTENFDWHKIGLKYYDSPFNKRIFKVLDYSKWMQHWMLVKIANGI
jgi:hypothetical protein